ncbi:hypothetical protein QOZ80_3AG0226640 [Eleusine coracana subsp. coracana]|nr:hypothetical protein QOZ80_3AG0226640 [Eleusine coracana subsp. coracana]
MILRHHVEHLEKNVVLVDMKTAPPPSLEPAEEVKSTSILGVPPLTGGGLEPNGHRVDSNHRGSAYMSVTTIAPTPIKGTPVSPNLQYPSFAYATGETHVNPQFHSPFMHNPSSHSFLELDFPCFDGDNPKYWRRKCEDYFSMCGIPIEQWVRMATYHFSGTTSLWVQAQTEFTSWQDLCARLVEHFGRDQYQEIIRQLFAIRQENTVYEYMSRFEPLMNQILAHNPSYDPVFFTTRFVDGLRPDIRATITLHRPKDLDIAYSLASVQENVASHTVPRYNQVDNQSLQKPRFPMLPAPPVRLALEGPHNDKKSPEKKGAEDRLTALRAYRRARGLCFKYGEKWGNGHKCAATVQFMLWRNYWIFYRIMILDHPEFKRKHQMRNLFVACLRMLPRVQLDLKL